MSQTKKDDKAVGRFSPATDIVEMEDGFYIYMDLPGVTRENLLIDLDGDEVKVTGKAEYPAPEGEKLGHVEFGSGEYVRSFTVSQVVDKERIKAQLQNGVLELHLPKAEAAKPRKIEIQAG
ncbi:Hsp20/alpha crystallin family protein [Desulfovibrio inopinatus]|uniref:Hsp20/alpha crystallin family protein n=1 Tax=Desulfovibrio inopinatus TaxID=102109 RepID=UPI000413D7A7|nr:Hsp20/alpha crystallin family protein [Desulfovibrio inopinatus]